MKSIYISRNVRLLPETWQKLEVLADKNNVRVASLIRAAIVDYLKYRQ
jgi:predicted transcriptional regulator